MRSINKLSNKHISQLHQYYQNEWWSEGRTLEETTLCINNSHVVGIVDEHDDLIAFSRVLTDGVFKAQIYDVIVSDEYRGHGIGKRLLHEIKTHKALKRVKHIELYCKPDMVPFYEKYGFDCDLGDVTLMRYPNA